MEKRPGVQWMKLRYSIVKAVKPVNAVKMIQPGHLTRSVLYQRYRPVSANRIIEIDERS